MSSSYFIIDWDIKAGQIVAHETLDDPEQAILRRSELNRRASPDHTILLFVGRSFDGLRVTHGRYFRKPPLGGSADADATTERSSDPIESAGIDAARSAASTSLAMQKVNVAAAS